MTDELTFPAEWSRGSADWETIAKDFDAQLCYLLRRCLVAEGNDPDDAPALEALIADVEDVGRL